MEQDIKLPHGIELLVSDLYRTEYRRFIRITEVDGKRLVICESEHEDYLADGTDDIDCAWEHAETVDVFNEAGNEFTYWAGGEMPVSGWLEVEVIYGDGEKKIETADYFAGQEVGWHRYSYDWMDELDCKEIEAYHIIAYRIIGGQKIL
jgi:hypothetical protein